MSARSERSEPRSREREVTQKVVIVGYGMAGARLAAQLKKHDVTVLGAETHPAYNRILLSEVLAGRRSEADTRLPTPRSAEVRLGEAVQAVDPVAKTVTTTQQVYPYDALVLATGSAAIVPRGFEGAPVFRTLDDCRAIVAQADGAKTAIVLGGGLLGIEAARGLAGRGLTVTVVHAAGHLMERQLDPAASDVLGRTLAELGIDVVVDAMAVGLVPDGRGLRLADGRELGADLVVVSCGVRAETGLARDAGLAVNRGILVDATLRTSDPDIFAIGDCAEHPGSISGLVAPAWEQARVVADLLTGNDPHAVYRPVPPVTRLKAVGIDLAAMGESTNGNAEAITYADPVAGRYAKLVRAGDKLTGAIMLGDHPSVGAVIQYFDRQLPLPPDLRPLLMGRPGSGQTAEAADTPALMPDAATVCRCNAVTKGEIKKAWLAGRTTQAGTGCGSCKDVLTGITSWLAAQDTQPAQETREVVGS